MNCKTVQKKLLDYSEGILEQKASAQIETHLKSCVRCAQELKTFEDTVRLLQSVPIKEPSEEFWNDFTKGVMQNVRRVERTTASSRFVEFPRLRFSFVAVATILLAAIGVFFFIRENAPKNNLQQTAQQAVEITPSIGDIDEVLEKIVPSKIVDDVLHTEWTLIDGQQSLSLDIDTSDDTIDFLLEDLTESEKQTLLVELERLLR